MEVSILDLKPPPLVCFDPDYYLVLFLSYHQGLVTSVLHDQSLSGIAPMATEIKFPLDLMNFQTWLCKCCCQHYGKSDTPVEIYSLEQKVPWVLLICWDLKSFILLLHSFDFHVASALYYWYFQNQYWLMEDTSFSQTLLLLFLKQHFWEYFLLLFMMWIGKTVT